MESRFRFSLLPFRSELYLIWSNFFKFFDYRFSIYVVNNFQFWGQFRLNRLYKLVFSSFRALDVDDKCEFAYETLGTIEVQRGNLSKAIELFEKAIPLANTELEMGHLFGLRDAATAQTTVSTRLGLNMPGMMS